MAKLAFKLLALGAAGGTIVYAAFILFLLPGGWRAYLEKRSDFSQLYVYNVGEKFIDIDFRLPDGRPTRLSRYPHKVVLVNFFTSSSAPCNAEAPRLERLAATYRNQGLMVIGVDVNESASEAQAYPRNHRLSFPIWRVENTVEGGFTVPLNLVIDDQDVVRYSGPGQPFQDLEKSVADLMAK